MVQDEFEIGRVVAGKYRIENLIGEGGLGRVLAATHLELDQLVAIKHLKAEFAQQAVLGERFAREARLAARIRSDHVVRVLDVARTEGGATFIVMEFLEGRDLGGTLAASGALPVREAIDYVLQACEALAEAHAIGVVHRDLKPDNLFVASRAAGSSILKVLDFGISKVLTAQTGAAGARPRALTTDTDKLGTPAYMSPEQIRASTDVDVRADIWAMGVVLYELLAASLPFPSNHIPMLCVQIATEPPTPLRSKRPDIPAELEAIVLQCLEKDRDLRFRNVGELALALAPFGPEDAQVRAEHIKRVVVAGGGSIRPPQPSFQSIAANPTEPQIASPAGATVSSWAPDVLSRRRGVGLIALAASLLAGTLVIFFAFRSPAPIASGHVQVDEPPSAAPSTSVDPSPPFTAPAAPPAPSPPPVAESAAASPAESTPAPAASTPVRPRARDARPKAPTAPAPTTKAAAASAAPTGKNAEFGGRQ